MNTIRSTWYGWGALCVAGGGAYYFAKQSINADRAARHQAEQEKQFRLQRMERFNSTPPTQTTSKKATKVQTTKGNMAGDGGAPHRGEDHAGSPSSEASVEEAPVGHAPVTNEQKVEEKSKYEAAEVYRSKKGDRLG